MFTKYKIKLDKDGLTILQWVNPGASRTTPALSGNNSLKETIAQSKQATAAKPAPGSSGASTDGASIESPGSGGDGFDSSIEPPGGDGFDSSIEPPGGDGFDSSIEPPGGDGFDSSIEPPGGRAFPGAGTGAPITIIGPNIFIGSQHLEKEKES
jgi:hypothetical protein